MRGSRKNLDMYDLKIISLKIISILLFLFSLLGLMGGRGFFMGRPIFSGISAIFGAHFAWIGLFLFLVIAIVLWIYSDKVQSFRSRSQFKSQSQTTTRNVHSKAVAKAQRKRQTEVKPTKSWLTSPKPNEEGIPLPGGKLVNLHGFNHYFSSPEWVEIKDVDQEQALEMNELGEDFPSYFAAGESFLLKKTPKLTLLRGIETYFEDVDHEETPKNALPKSESNRPVVQENLKENPCQAKSIFKSQADQAEFLAQFKIDNNPTQRDLEENFKVSSDQQCCTDPQDVDLKPENKPDLQINHTINTVTAVKECSLKDERISDPHIVLDSDGGEKKPGFNTESKMKFVAELIQEPISDPRSVSEITTDQILESALEPSPITHVPITFDDIPENVPENIHEDIHEDVHEHNLEDKPQNHPLWESPDFSLLDPVALHSPVQDPETSRLLEKVLLDFGVKAKVIRVTSGPVITRYELAPAPGVKISKIVNLADDIALGLAARDVRIEAPIPGKAAIGIEVPNKQARSVPFREVLETPSFRDYSSKLKVALGKDIADQPIVADLIKMPHLLVAGATGSGKSVCITSIINSILFNATPAEVKFLLVDPKMVELSQYNGIPHLLAPVVVDPKKAASALKWIVKEMENRYELFAAAGVRDVVRYNKLKSEVDSSIKLPYIVVIIDELADLMLVAPGEVEEAICRLAQMARAAGIHLVIATQRPSVDVITGVIKANIPSRISFAVSSQIDSRTILDATGAEKLLGKGDMLYSPLGVNKALRVQGCLVTDEEVQKIIAHWKNLGKPEYLDPERLFAETPEKNDEGNGPDDALFFEAGKLCLKSGIASTSFLQRRLKLGYTRAARLMDMLEDQGVVGAYEGSKPRQVLITMDEFLERFG
ncbi:DNA translocase FtsK [Desulfosporosinus sp. SYSU MS00001]|uniref:DNA translocase FtsK n=1 Tax=Desulfosporosinus sp. SYSU MS00001 TaxID=3416284 RepID=UPI003CEC2851